MKMKYKEDYEEISFPPVIISSKDELKTQEDLKSYKKPRRGGFFSNKKNIWIIVGAISFVLLIILIIVLAVSLKKKPGGYITLDYLVESNDKITIFNPPKGLNKKDYSITLTQTGNNNNLRLLENNVNVQIEGNQFNTKEKGIIQLRISFNKAISTMAEMFKDCNKLIKADLSNFESSKVTSMNSAFLNCAELESANFDYFNSKKVENMDRAFENCERLPGLNLSSFETPKLKSMNSMFKNCVKLYILDISNFNLNKVQINNAL